MQDVGQVVVSDVRKFSVFVAKKTIILITNTLKMQIVNVYTWHLLPEIFHFLPFSRQKALCRPGALQRSRASVLKYVRATRIKNTTDLCEALENNRHCVCQSVTGMSKNNSKRMRITITCDGKSPRELQEQVAKYIQLLGVGALDIFPWVR